MLLCSYITSKVHKAKEFQVAANNHGNGELAILAYRHSYTTCNPTCSRSCVLLASCFPSSPPGLVDPLGPDCWGLMDPMFPSASGFLRRITCCSSGVPKVLCMPPPPPLHNGIHSNTLINGGSQYFHNQHKLICLKRKNKQTNKQTRYITILICA